jgi:hypothetical protein
MPSLTVTSKYGLLSQMYFSNLPLRFHGKSKLEPLASNPVTQLSGEECAQARSTFGSARHDGNNRET